MKPLLGHRSSFVSFHLQLLLVSRDKFVFYLSSSPPSTRLTIDHWIMATNHNGHWPMVNDHRPLGGIVFLDRDVIYLLIPLLLTGQFWCMRTYIYICLCVCVWIHHAPPRSTVASSRIDTMYPLTTIGHNYPQQKQPRLRSVNKSTMFKTCTASSPPPTSLVVSNYLFLQAPRLHCLNGPPLTAVVGRYLLGVAGSNDDQQLKLRCPIGQ